MLACLEACLQNRRDESFKKHFGFTYDLVRCIHIRDGVHLSHVFVSPSFATALGGKVPPHQERQGQGERTGPQATGGPN